MKILIIGSKGFIGSHFVEYFSGKHEVWECDVVNDYNNPNYFLVDTTNADYNDIFQQQSFDVCINCSGAASVPDSIVHPQRDFVLNAYNVFKQLDAIRKYAPECKYINLSSAAVYGNPEQLPVSEAQKCSPISPYGKHKQMAENICAEFTAYFNLHTCSVRIFSAYGPGLKKQLFWDLYKRAKKADMVQLYGTGLESRDFIYISDLARAVDCVIANGRFEAEVVNVANGKEILIKEAVAIFCDIFNKKISFVFGGESRQGDPANWVADIAILKQLGYKQNVSLKEGLTKYIAWLKEKE